MTTIKWIENWQITQIVKKLEQGYISKKGLIDHLNGDCFNWTRSMSTMAVDHFLDNYIDYLDTRTVTDTNERVYVINNVYHGFKIRSINKCFKGLV